MLHSLTSISKPNEIARLEQLMNRVVEPPAHLNMKWVEEEKQIAVPVESASHFDDRDAKLLADAMLLEGCTKCFAISTEPLDSFPRCLSLGTTKDDLLIFSRECSHFNFLIVPTALSFAVLCTVYDYFIISGTKKFVENAIGCTIAESRARFVEFVEGSDQSRRLFGVAKRYDREV